MGSEALSQEKKAEITKIFSGLNDAHVTRKINEIQQKLLAMVVDEDMLEFINEATAAVKAA